MTERAPSEGVAGTAAVPPVRQTKPFFASKGFRTGGAVLVALLVLLGAGLIRPLINRIPAIEAAFGRRAGISAGQAAPDFTLTLLDGGVFRLAEHRGQGVVLNFWASWCTPCRAEMPYFETTYRTYQERGVLFLGVGVQDTPESARAFLRELAITYPSGLDEGNEIALRYQLIGLPTTVFIAPDGKVTRKQTGAISEDQLVTFVEEITP